MNEKEEPAPPGKPPTGFAGAQRFMCCRYYVPGEMSEFMLLKYLDSINREKVRPKTGEIFPTDLTFVLVGGREVTVAALKWGFSTAKGPVFNARGETYTEKPFFRPYARNRAAAFCSEYYEWKNKVKYAVKSADGSPIFLAGIYRNMVNGEGEFTILTLPPIPKIAPLHDRMPLALTGAAAEKWLQGAGEKQVFDGIQDLYYETA